MGTHEKIENIFENNKNPTLTFFSLWGGGGRGGGQTQN
jgi:hypothetical protein